MKDRFYEEVVNEPSREKFREFIKNNVGELDEVDFKEQWISKGELSKLLLAMANSRGGVIVIGIKENDDGTLEPIGLEELKDKAGSLNLPDLDRNILTAILTRRLLYWCDHLNDSELINVYKKHSFLLGKEVSFIQNGETIIGTAVDINEDGNLIVESEQIGRAHV